MGKIFRCEILRADSSLRFKDIEHNFGSVGRYCTEEKRNAQRKTGFCDPRVSR